MRRPQRQSGYADKQGLIISRLRGAILDGTYAPGGRIPKRTELEEEFQVSPVTMQKAIDRLVDDGFLYARGKAGTFVSDRPPHVNRYGIVFPSSPSTIFGSDWPRYWEAISNEARVVEAERNIQIEMFHSVMYNSNTEARSRLVRDVQSHRVAGLIFPFSPDAFGLPEIVNNKELPVVTLGTGGIRKPVLEMASLDLIDRALDCLMAAGRKRIAVIMIPGVDFFQAHWKVALAARGLVYKQYWMQLVGNSQPNAARNVAHLLMNPGQKERPDGLIILDDNLVEAACAGLSDAGIACPEELMVIGHCNFPWTPLTSITITRLGFDCAWMVRKAVDLIDQIRQGEPVPALTVVRPVFDHELAAAQDSMNQPGSRGVGRRSAS